MTSMSAENTISAQQHAGETQKVSGLDISISCDIDDIFSVLYLEMKSFEGQDGFGAVCKIED